MIKKYDPVVVRDGSEWIVSVFHKVCSGNKYECFDSVWGDNGKSYGQFKSFKNAVPLKGNESIIFTSKEPLVLFEKKEIGDK